MTTQRHTLDDARIVPEMELCDRMRRALRLTSFSSQDVAEFLGVRRETVSTWINGKRRPSHAVLMLWADMTGVELDWLEYGTAGLENQTGRDQYAIRDSNPEPADMSSRRRLTLAWSVNRRLTVDRIPAGDWPDDVPEGLPARESARHLTAVS